MKLVRMICICLIAALGAGVLTSCAAWGWESTEALSHVSLRINPEIELLADEAGKVLAANAVNEDGEILLASVDLEGKHVEEAAALFTEAASDLGYFDPEGEKDTVYVDVESTLEDGGAALERGLSKSICDYFDNNGIGGKVAPETLERYADKAAAWGLSAGHTKLAMRVLDMHPELTEDEVLQMKVKEWLSLLKGKKNEEKIAAGLKKGYRERIEALKEEYAEMFALRAEIDALEESGADDALLAEKKAEYKELHDAYKAQAKEIKEEFKESSKAARRAYREEAKSRRKAEKSKK